MLPAGCRLSFKHDHTTFVGMSVVPCQQLISNTVGPINTRVKYGHGFETWDVHGNGHQEKMEDTKALIRGRKSKKERPSEIGQQNKQCFAKKKLLRKLEHKNTIPTKTNLHKEKKHGGELMISGRVSSSCSISCICPNIHVNIR